MKIVTILRVKNEGRWLQKVFDSISDICSGIIVLDGMSTDNTISICKNHDKVIEIIKQDDTNFDERRDRNALLEAAIKENPDFIFSLDGDQVLQPNAKNILKEEINVLYTHANVFEFQELTIYDQPNQYRYDGVYSNNWIKKLLRLSNQSEDLRYDESGYPGNAHCSQIPQKSLGYDNPVRSRLKIFHYGNYDESLRQQKYKFYTDLDPLNTTFGGYKHIISDSAKFSGSKGYDFRQIPEDLYLTDIE